MYRASRTGFDGIAPFSDPYVDIASTVVPTNHASMLRHAEFLAVAGDGILREAYNRVAAFFITELEIDGDLGDDEKTKQKDYLTSDMNVNAFMLSHSLSGLVYGVRYLSVLKPFTRYVVCPRCGANFRFHEFAAATRHEFKWGPGFQGRCLACDYSGDFGDPLDVDDDSKPLILKSWNPHDMRIDWNDATGQAGYFDWVIPADFRTEARTGSSHFVLASTPWTWLRAAYSDMNIRFTEEQVKYWHEPALAGLRFRGVGVPRTIVNLRRMYFTQILLRMQEVLAIGHVAPMRVISPANTAGRGGEETDIFRTLNAGDVRSRIMRMVAAHRYDPNSIQASPIPLQMQALGADARNLIPADVTNQAIEMELNAAGIPVDLFKMTMTQQAAPIGLRLFARHWAPFADSIQSDMGYIARRTQVLNKWEKARYRYGPPQIVDDIELRSLEMSMAQAGLLARGYAIKRVGTTMREQTRYKMEDLEVEQEEQAKSQQRQDAFSFSREMANAGGPPQLGPPGQAQPGQPQQPQQSPGGQVPAGAAPAGTDPLAGMIPQPGAKIDPATMYSQAQAAAQTLSVMPESERFSKLQEIRKVNPPFHGIVKQCLADIRSDDRSKGQKMMEQSRQQGQSQ
jgi:hypothetical protein